MQIDALIAPVAQSVSHPNPTVGTMEQEVMGEVLATLHEPLDAQQEAFVAEALEAHRAAEQTEA